VTYEQPSAVNIYINIVIKFIPGLPANLADLIKSEILSLFSTPNNTFGAIGSTVYAGSLYGPVSGVSPNVQVISIGVGAAPNPSGLDLPTNIDQYPHVPIDGSTIQVGIV
jgi:hypothetical protein